MVSKSTWKRRTRVSAHSWLPVSWAMSSWRNFYWLVVPQFTTQTRSLNYQLSIFQHFFYRSKRRQQHVDRNVGINCLFRMLYAVQCKTPQRPLFAFLEGLNATWRAALKVIAYWVLLRFFLLVRLIFSLSWISKQFRGANLISLIWGIKNFLLEPLSWFDRLTDTFDQRESYSAVIRCRSTSTLVILCFNISPSFIYKSCWDFWIRLNSHDFAVYDMSK